jgi:hypothetical protein
MEGGWVGGWVGGGVESSVHGLACEGCGVGVEMRVEKTTAELRGDEVDV